MKGLNFAKSRLSFWLMYRCDKHISEAARANARKRIRTWIAECRKERAAK